MTPFWKKTSIEKRLLFDRFVKFLSFYFLLIFRVKVIIFKQIEAFLYQLNPKIILKHSLETFNNIPPHNRRLEEIFSHTLLDFSLHKHSYPLIAIE